VFVLDRSTGLSYVQIHVLAALNLEKRPPISIGKEGVSVSEQVVMLWKTEKCFAPTGKGSPYLQLPSQQPSHCVD
jgi:hypothetical protein